MLLFESYLKGSQSKINAVKNCATKLNWDPNWIMAVIYKESAKTFSPSIWNPAHTAIGIIQFTQIAAKQLGTTLAAISTMSFEQQMDLVYKFYYPYRNKVKSYSDVYLVTFFPVALNHSKDLNYVFQANGLSKENIALQNPAINLNHDDKITMAEFQTYCLAGFVPSVQELLKKKI